MREIDHSFAILAYKESPYLEECIRSLVSQTKKSNIYISTSTPSRFLDRLAKKYELRIHLNKKSSGIASDWSFAYNASGTRYVTLAHQDDLYGENFSLELMKRRKLEEESLIFFTNYGELVNGESRFYTLNLVIKRVICRFFFLFSDSIRVNFLKTSLLSFGSPIPCPSVTYDRQHLNDFNFSEEFKINMDWDAWLRIAEKRGSFVRIEKNLMLHRIHPESETTKGISDNRRYNEDLRMFSRIWPAFFVKFIAKIYKLSYGSNAR